jgi:hypothetical protein
MHDRFRTELSFVFSNDWSYTGVCKYRPIPVNLLHRRDQQADNFMPVGIVPDHSYMLFE